MSITPRFLDDLRTRLTLSDMIGRRIKLTRAGREFKACCPFHKEKSASFYVNDDKQFFHCFGCGAHGDVVGFTMRYENLSFPEAVRNLAAQAGLQMPDFTPEDAVKAEVHKTLYTLMETAALWFEAQLILPKNRVVYEYLANRALSPETMTNFRLGFAPGDDRMFIDHMRAAGYNDDQLILAGLAKRREKGNTLYGFFRERVMFPVMDRSGRIIAFGGRILPDNIRLPEGESFKPPKYLNSPETPLFQKGRTVYAVSHARAAAGEGRPIVVVEGYMDVIACHQAGVDGAVAPLGTALTEDQITLLWRLMSANDKTIILCFDGDAAGIRAAERAADRILPLLKPDHSASIAFLPQGEDPDTLIASRGVAAFHNILTSGLPLAEYVWHLKSSTRTTDRPEDRAGLEADLEAVVNKIVDPKTKYHYQNFFRSKMRERFRPAQQTYQGKAPARGSGFKGGAFVPSIKPTGRPSARVGKSIDVLLASMMLHPFLFGAVDEKFGLLHIDDPARDGLRQDLIEMLSGAEINDGESFVTMFCESYPDHADLVRMLLSDQVMVFAPFAKVGADPADVLAGWEDIFHNINSPQEKGLGR